MAAQNMHSQDSITKEEAPQSLYELLIYDNKKLVSNTEGPHIIMRRALKGSAAEIVEKFNQSEEVSENEDDDGTEEVFQETDNHELAEEVEYKELDAQQSSREDTPLSSESSESPKEAADYAEMVSADSISSYLASLSNHGQSDVLRVVDAITDLEEAESIQNNEEIEEEPAVEEQKKEEGKGKKVLKIADIFDSLKKARKKAQQKNYSYTKKVEYEDH